MEVTFDDAKLQRLVERQDALRRKYGESRARKIRTRLATLRAAESMAELRPAPGRWHQLVADHAEQWAADLDQPYRLIVRPSEPVPRLDDGGVDWHVVTRVAVVSIEDYH